MPLNDGSAINTEDEDVLEIEAAAAISESNIQGSQIPDDIDNCIVLPPQRRCFAHLLNLIGKCYAILIYKRT